MKLQFTKMHALGNDFIVIDNRKSKLKNLSLLSKKLCHRKFGIGADQLLMLCNSKKADFKMRIFNPDGGEAEMCGNGIRCLAKYVWDKKVKSEKLKMKSKKSNNQQLAIETLAGIIHIEKKGGFIKVDMGEPVFEPEKIPVKISQESGVRSGSTRAESPELPPFNSPLDKGACLSGRQGHRRVYDEIINYPLQIDDRKFKITCLSMGNPHAVIVVKDAASFPVSLYGPVIEKHGMFPRKTNVEIIQILNRKNIKMRVWERGAGETMACGTGASASAVASALLGLSDRKATVRVLGGKLTIEWAKNNHVYMTGPAVEVFEGTLKY